MAIHQIGSPITHEASDDLDSLIYISPTKVKSKAQKENKGEMIVILVDVYVRAGMTD